MVLARSTIGKAPKFAHTSKTFRPHWVPRVNTMAPAGSPNSPFARIEKFKTVIMQETCEWTGVG